MTDRPELLERFNVSRETIERLEVYAALLRRWNQRVNLVSASTIDELWRRHILDSIQLVPLAPANTSRWVDLGAGAGLPGLIVAIAMMDSMPAVRVRLIESDQRKCAFLREAARLTEVQVTISSARIEQAKESKANVVSARALASLDQLLGMAQRFLAPGGVLLFPKGRSAQEELTKARLRWHIECSSVISLSDPEAVIFRISDFSPRSLA